MLKLVQISVGLVLGCALTIEAQAAQFHCRAIGLRSAGISANEEIEKYAGFAEIRPEKQFDVLIDTERLLLTVKDTVLALSNLKGVSIESGIGFSADIPSVGGTVVVRYRETDEFFAVVMGGYTIGGNCPRSSDTAGTKSK